MLKIFVAALLLVTVDSNPDTGQQSSKDPKCECELRYLQHYEAKGCVPIYEEAQGNDKSNCTCPRRFHCLPRENSEVCVYKGHVYEIGSIIPTSNKCLHCRCSLYPAITMDCVATECFSPFDFGPMPKECRKVYTENKCCPTVECDEERKETETTTKVPLCKYKDRMYYEGDTINSEEDPCLHCSCNSNWTGINGTSCWRYDCILESYSKYLNRGCIPMYLENHCCPIEYHCPDKDKIARIPNMEYKDKKENMCYFEGLYYSIGDILDIKHPYYCVNCTCKIPPDFTCIYSRCPLDQKFTTTTIDYENSRPPYKPHDNKVDRTLYDGQQLSKDPECECSMRYLSHYETKGCDPVYEKSPGNDKSNCTCPRRFDCSQVDKINASNEVCVYSKRVYKIGSKILTSSKCWNCSCEWDNSTDAAYIHCYDDPWKCSYKDPGPGCTYLYIEDECCPTVYCPPKIPRRRQWENTERKENTSKDLCGPNEEYSDCASPCNDCDLKGNCEFFSCNKGCDCIPGYRRYKGICIAESQCPLVPICNYDGHMYYEGELIIPHEEDECIECLCSSNWTGIYGPSCRRSECLNQQYVRLLRQGCIPIYSDYACCTRDYHCPDKVKVLTEPRTEYKDNEEEMCYFEGHFYSIGDNLDVKYPRSVFQRKQCVECTCKIPPDFSCIFIDCPLHENSDNENSISRTEVSSTIDTLIPKKETEDCSADINLLCQYENEPDKFPETEKDFKKVCGYFIGRFGCMNQYKDRCYDDQKFKENYEHFSQWSYAEELLYAFKSLCDKKAPYYHVFVDNLRCYKRFGQKLFLLFTKCLSQIRNNSTATKYTKALDQMMKERIVRENDYYNVTMCTEYFLVTSCLVLELKEMCDYWFVFDNVLTYLATKSGCLRLDLLPAMINTYESQQGPKFPKWIAYK